MDPNETLSQLRSLLGGGSPIKVDENASGDEMFVVIGERLMEVLDLFQALNQWLSKGGFPPEDWSEVGTSLKSSP